RLKDTTYVKADLTDAHSVHELLSGITGPLVIYFALPPAVTRKCCEAIAAADLPTPTVLAMEKPFGGDVDSARSLNQLLLTLVPEEHIFRVDHFLGRSTLLNLLSVRLTNRVFAP